MTTLDDVKGIGMSNCCGADVYKLGDMAMCCECKEYCEEEFEEKTI